MADLSIIIVNWNVCELLQNCLNSLERHLNDLSYEIIVIDNASTDNSIQVLGDKYPKVKLIENKKNEGFARANNQGFRIAQGNYILILNPDTVIKDDSIQKMINILDHNPSIGLVGPRIIYKNGEITPACKRRDITLWRLFLNRFLIEKIVIYLINHMIFFKIAYNKYFYTSESTASLQGACMLARKRDLDDVGYFDEEVPMYLDDIDLCYRFRKKGFKVFYTSEAEIIHACGASTKKSFNPKSLDLIVYQGVDRFLYKHKGLIQVFFHRIILFSAAFLFILIDIFLMPLLFLSKKRKYGRDVLSKHIGMLVYSLNGTVKTKNFLNYKNE